MFRPRVLLTASIILSGMAVISVVGTNRAAGEDETSIVPSRETTHIVEPLRPDGSVDYLAAINARASEGVTLENNAAVLLMQALGPDYEGFGEDWWKAAWKALGTEPLSSAGEPYQSLEQVLRNRGIPQSKEEALRLRREVFDRVSYRPWRRNDFPSIAAWVDANEDFLALVHRAVRRSGYYMPYIDAGMEIGYFDPELPAMLFGREIGKLLSIRAMLRLGEGRHLLAMSDLESAHRMASLLASQGWFAFEPLIGFAIEGSVFGADDALIAHGQLTAQEWLAYRDRLSQLPDARDPIRMIDETERWTALDATAVLERSSLERQQAGANRSVKVALLILGRLDWNLVLKRLNSRFDRTVSLAKTEDRKQRSRDLEQFESDLRRANQNLRKGGVFEKAKLRLKSRPERSEIMGDILAQMFLPAAERQINAAERFRTRRRVLQVGLTLAAFKAKTGTYPQSLSVLVPDYLEALPIDIYTGKPFEYRRTANGFRLWSISQDEFDGGGCSVWKAMPNGDPCDDITLRVPNYPIPQPEN